jgi:AcrR family transcriptional regulator
VTVLTKTPRSQRREASRGAILEAAIELLAANGYPGMRLADVSRVAGVSYGLASFYFESKAGLLMAIQKEIDARFTAYMAAACDESAPGRAFVEQWITGLFGFAKGHRAHWRASVMILVESVGAAPEVAAEHTEFVGRNVGTLRDAFARGIADGSIPASIDPRSAAVAVEALVKGINLDWFSDPTIDLDERRELVIGVVRQLMGS